MKNVLCIRTICRYVEWFSPFSSSHVFCVLMCAWYLQSQVQVSLAVGGLAIPHRHRIAIFSEWRMHFRIVVYLIIPWWHRKFVSHHRVHHHLVVHQAVAYQFDDIVALVHKSDADQPSIYHRQRWVNHFLSHSFAKPIFLHISVRVPYFIIPLNSVFYPKKIK